MAKVDEILTQDERTTSILLKGDCFIESAAIGDGSVDLILTDLPYGNMDGGPSRNNGHLVEIRKWDFAIDPKDVFEIANRILRKNGKMILFSQEPYTTRLISEAIPNVPFSYRAMWMKDTFANALGVNKAMVSMYEDVLVFSKTHSKHDFDGKHPLRPYFADVLRYIGLRLKQINERLGHRRAEHTFYVNSSQFSLCTENTYRELIAEFNIDSMPGFKEFTELKEIDSEYRTRLITEMNEENPSVFNLWEGGKYKSNILRYKKDYDGFHPTQKPVLLLEDLIKTFSNEGDMVVDLTMGSGSTGVAAVRTGRRFTGIEQDADYYEIARQRVADAQKDVADVE